MLIFFILTSLICSASATVLSDLPTSLLWRIIRKGEACLLISQNRAMADALSRSDPRDYAACHAKLLFSDSQNALNTVSAMCLPNTLAALYGFLQLSPDSTLMPQAFVSGVLAQCMPAVSFLHKKGVDINVFVHEKSPIFYAVEANLSEVVRVLVDLGASADFPILLGAAANLGYLKMIETLLELARARHVQLNCVYAMFGASTSNRTEVLTKLVDLVECQDRALLEGATVYAAQAGHFEPIALLVARGVTTLKALEIAAFYGRSELVAKIYHLRPIFPMPQDVLFAAVRGGSYQTVDSIIDLCDEHDRSNSFAFIRFDDPTMLCLIASRMRDVYSTPLYVNTYLDAASHGRTNMLQIFLSRTHRDECLWQVKRPTGHFGHIEDVDVDVFNGAAMISAANALEMDTVRYLLSMGSQSYASAMYAAVKVRDLELARTLVELPGNKELLGVFMMQQIILRDHTGVTDCLQLGAIFHRDAAFGTAVGTGDSAMVQTFASGSDPTQLVRHTLTACKKGHLDIVKLLFKMMGSNNITPDSTEILSLMNAAVFYQHVAVAAFIIDQGVNPDIYLYRLLSVPNLSERVAPFLKATAHVHGLCYQVVGRALSRGQMTEQLFLTLLPVFSVCGITKPQLHYLAAKRSFFGFITNQAETGSDLVADGCCFGVLEGLSFQGSYSMALVRAGCSVHQTLPGKTAGALVSKLSNAILSRSFALRCLKCVKWALSPEVTPKLEYQKRWAAMLAVKSDFGEGFLLLQELAPLTLQQMNNLNMLQKAIDVGANEMVAILKNLGLEADSDTVHHDEKAQDLGNKRLRLH